MPKPKAKTKSSELPRWNLNDLYSSSHEFEIVNVEPSGKQGVLPRIEEVSGRQVTTVTPS